jgi:integrase
MKQEKIVGLRRVTSNTPAPNNAVLNFKVKPVRHVSHKEPLLNQITSQSPAMKYWLDETLSKEPSTRKLYVGNFEKFLQWLSKTPDELLKERQNNLRSTNPKVQRIVESYLIKFIADQKNNGYSPATLQIIFASVRSFFEIHYFPLIMRRGDYPKGDSNGVKRATKEAILKVLSNKTRNHVTIKPLILFIKDTGLRVSDVRRLKYGDISHQFERGDKIIQINIIAQKTKLLAKTFMGEESIQALKGYFEARRKGSRNVAPEVMTKNSPLFKLWAHGKVQQIKRHSISSLIR